MSTDYSEPKIYTGGVKLHEWPSLSKQQQKDALKKHWYVYYSYRNPKTGKLQRQSAIKGGANRFKDKISRFKILSKLQEALSYVLREGFNPYVKDKDLVTYLENCLLGKAESTEKKVVKVERKPEPEPQNENFITIENAFQVGLKTKERVLGKDSYTKFKSHIYRFKKWLPENKVRLDQDIQAIDKKIVIQYLNVVLNNTSPRTRNNARTDLSSLFQTLEDNDIIPNNFIKKINVLLAIPTRHKTYTPDLLKKIDNYLIEHDPTLRIFIHFISYNFLRPIEVCRLRVGDIDSKQKLLYVKAKNQPVKTKIIPDILLKELPDLSKFNENDFLFTPDGIGGAWETEVTNKRNYFTNRFKKVKKYLELGTDYSMYSFRHTFITKIYREMAKSATPFEVKSNLKLITGHSSMTALEKYLRDIDAALPEDYSKLLE